MQFTITQPEKPDFPRCKKCGEPLRLFMATSAATPEDFALPTEHSTTCELCGGCAAVIVIGEPENPMYSKSMSVCNRCLSTHGESRIRELALAKP